MDKPTGTMLKIDAFPVRTRLNLLELQDCFLLTFSTRHLSKLGLSVCCVLGRLCDRAMGPWIRAANDMNARWLEIGTKEFLKEDALLSYTINFSTRTGYHDLISANKPISCSDCFWLVEMRALKILPSLALRLPS